jgi:glycine/D-amino acid oxidase-like deaminating enzyme
MKKILATPHTTTAIIGAGITGLLQALYLTLQGKPATLIEKGEFCTGPSALTGQLHLGLEYILDPSTQKWCFYATVLFHAILPNMFLHEGLTHFGVSTEIEASQPQSLEALHNSAGRINTLTNTLFYGLELEAQKLLGTEADTAKNIIALLKTRLLLPSGVAAEPLQPSDFFPYRDKETTAYKTSQKSIKGLMFLTFIQEFLKHRDVPIFTETAATSLHVNGVETNKGFIQADHIIVATGIHYPGPGTIFKRGMLYITTPPRPLFLKDSYFLVPGTYGGMLEYAGSVPNGDIYKAYAPHASGCQISAESFSDLESISLSSLDTATETSLLDHSTETFNHIDKRYVLGEITEKHFCTRWLAQHSQQGLHSRPYTPKKPSTTLPNTTYCVSDKFTYAVFNLFTPDQLTCFESGDYKTLLNILVDLYTTFQPFMKFCNLSQRL